MHSVWKSVTPLVPVPHSSVNIYTTVSAVPIMLLTPLMTRSLNPVLLKTAISQVSTPQTVSSKHTLNHLSPLALLPLNHTVFVFLLPPTVKLSLVRPYFLAYLLCLLRLHLIHRRVPPPDPRDNLEPQLMLPDLLKALLLMQLPLTFLSSRLLVSLSLLFSYRKGQSGHCYIWSLTKSVMMYRSYLPHSQSLYYSIGALIR